MLSAPTPVSLDSAGDALRLYGPRDDWSADMRAQAPGSLWIYALSGRCLCICSSREQFSVHAEHVLLSVRPPADWSLSELVENDLIARIPAHALPSPSALCGTTSGPGLALDATQSRLLRHLLEALSIEAGSQAGAEGVWRMHLQDAILAFVATAAHTRELAAGPGATTVPARDQRRLARMTDYMRGRLGAPLSSEDLARAAGLSIRALHSLCQRHLRTTPMDLLRAMRLEAVHQHLCKEPDTPVGDVALRLGFGHLGRFSAYYRERFGELPHETRARQLGHRSGGSTSKGVKPPLSK